MITQRLRAFTGSIAGSRLTQHFSVLALGSLLGLLLDFLVQTYLARQLPVFLYGRISVARNIINYLILGLNFGFETYFLRAMVHGQLSAGRAAAMQIMVRLPLSVLSTLALVWWAAQGGWSSERLFIMLFGLLALSYAFNLDWLQQVRERFSALAALNFGRSLLVLVLTAAFVHGKADAWRYVLAVALAEALRSLMQWVMLRPRLERVSLKTITGTVRTSVAISAAFIMTSIYYSIDSVMLAYFKGDETAGIYTAAYRFLTLAILPTQLLFQVFSPTLARNTWDKGVLKRYVLSTLLLSGAVFVGLAALHQPAISITYGPKYAASAPVLLMLSFNVLTSYLAGAFANPINTWGHYNAYLGVVTAGAIANFLFNLVMIPRYGITGAVATTIFSEAVVAVFAIVYVMREFRRRQLASGKSV